MALTERSRAALYLGLRGVIDDEEAVGEMLSYFPARDLEEPVTRDHLRAELTRVDGRLALFDGRLAVLEQRMDGLELRMGVLEQRMDRLELRMDRLEFRMDRLEERMGRLEERMVLQDQRMADGFAAVRADLSAEVRRMTAWTIGALVSLSGVVVAAGALG